MNLNTLASEHGSRKNAKRVGRGIGCGLGKTCGRGVKGQKSRSGGSIKAGFEGGQMPLQRRIPKFGFTSRKAKFSAQVCLSEINKLVDAVIDLDILKNAGIISKQVKQVKIILSGEITRAVEIKSAAIKVTKGAKAAIEAAGGKIEA